MLQPSLLFSNSFLSDVFQYLNGSLRIFNEALPTIFFILRRCESVNRLPFEPKIVGSNQSEAFAVC